MPAVAAHSDTLTFVVRLWREPDVGGRTRWRGRVEHVSSHEVGFVKDGATLMQFIERWTGDLSTAAQVGLP